MTDIYKRRRDEVIKQLGPEDALVLHAAPELVVGRDTHLRYVPDANLYYLTGYTEPEAVLVLLPRDPHVTMFVRPRDPARELWTGVRGGVEAAIEHYGATLAHPITELETRISALLGDNKPVDADVILNAMRMVKDEHELALMREAARITRDAFDAALQRVGPDVGEWEIEAAVEYEFRVRGADSWAFPSIAAAGANAATLHYVANNQRMKEGELFLLDAGARYGMYCADISRTVPVSGKFTEQQKDLYDVVAAAHRAAIGAVRAGAAFDAPHHAAVEVLSSGLSSLGYKEDIKTYFPHRTSHWLGLEVHDVGAYTVADAPLTLRPNMVMTIEPGVYLPGIGLGIRIEDDVVVTDDGCEVITA